jgi:hypothetical protein
MFAVDIHKMWQGTFTYTFVQHANQLTYSCCMKPLKNHAYFVSTCYLKTQTSGTGNTCSRFSVSTPTSRCTKSCAVTDHGTDAIRSQKLTCTMQKALQNARVHPALENMCESREFDAKKARANVPLTANPIYSILVRKRTHL